LVSKTQNFQNSLKIQGLNNRKIWLDSENSWFRIGIWLDILANIDPEVKIENLKLKFENSQNNGFHISPESHFQFYYFIRLSFGDANMPKSHQVCLDFVTLKNFLPKI
jgi:hypothetical protein